MHPAASKLAAANLTAHQHTHPATGPWTRHCGLQTAEKTSLPLRRLSIRVRSAFAAVPRPRRQPRTPRTHPHEPLVGSSCGGTCGGSNKLSPAPLDPCVHLMPCSSVMPIHVPHWVHAFISCRTHPSHHEVLFLVAFVVKRGGIPSRTARASAASVRPPSLDCVLSSFLRSSCPKSDDGTYFRP